LTVPRFETICGLCAENSLVYNCSTTPWRVPRRGVAVVPGGPYGHWAVLRLTWRHRRLPESRFGKFSHCGPVSDWHYFADPPSIKIKNVWHVQIQYNSSVIMAPIQKEIWACFAAIRYSDL